MFEALRKKKFVRFFGISLTGTIVAVVFVTMNSILTARILGPEQKGLYTLLHTTILLSVALASLKLGLSQAYFRKEYSLNEIASNTVFLTVTTGILTVVLAAAGIYVFYSDIYSEVAVALIFVVLCAVPLKVFAVNMRTMINADYDIPRSTIVQVSKPILFFVSFSSLALLHKANLTTAIYCVFFSIAGMALLGLYLLIKRGFSKFTLNKSLLKPMVSFSLKTHIGQMFKFMQYRFDIFLVAYFLSPREVGVYSIALALAEILWRIPRAANNVLLPRLRGESDRRSAELTARLNRIIFFFTLCCMLPLALLVDWVILIMYGEEYLDAANVVIVLLPGVLALSVFKLMTPNLIMGGRAWTFSFSVFCSVVIMVVLDLYLIPAYGIIGAGIASSAGYITASLIVSTTVVRTNDLPLLAYFDFTEELRLFLRARKGRG